MEPEKLELNKDTIQALARECYNQSLNREMLNFIMTEFGKELMKNQLFLTPTEIETKFRISGDRQKAYRNRSSDPLPYHKEVDCNNCGIVYQVETTLKWLERNFPESII